MASDYERDQTGKLGVEEPVKIDFFIDTSNDSGLLFL